MKNIRKIIIILVAILIILAILLIIIMNANSSETEYPESDANSGPQDTMIELNEHISKEIDDNKVFTINDFINESLDYENEGNTDAANKLIINYEDIEAMDLKQKQSKYYIQEAYKRENVDRANYYTAGILQTVDENYEEELMEIYFKINLDYKNNALCIYVINQETFEQTIQDQGSIVENFSVEQNEYNLFEQKSYNTEETCNRYISDFIIKLKYNKELAYNYIDD